MNKKSLVGLVVLLVAAASLIFSGRGLISDVDVQLSLSKMSDTVDVQGKALAALTARVERLEAVKTICNQSKTLPKLTTGKVGITTKNQVFHADAGQIVYLNAAGTKYHFWDGCTWFGYGEETTKEQAESGGAKECLLCQGHKVIKR